MGDPSSVIRDPVPSAHCPVPGWKPLWPLAIGISPEHWAPATGQSGGVTLAAEREGIESIDGG